MKYRTRTDLSNFTGALDEISAHSKKMQALLLGANATMLNNPLRDASSALGLAALQVGLEEMEAIASKLEEHAVRLLGEARRPGETAVNYTGRIMGMDVLATMKRNGLMLMPW